MDYIHSIIFLVGILSFAYSIANMIGLIFKTIIIIKKDFGKVSYKPFIFTFFIGISLMLFGLGIIFK